MKYRIGRSAHGDIQRHGVQESLTGSDTAGKNRVVAIAVILISIFYNLFGCIAEQLRTVSVRSDNRPVTRKRQTDRLVQAVHRVCRKHTGAATASGAGVPFDLCDPFVAHRCIGRFNHGIDQVEVAVIQLAGLHWTAGNKDGRDIKPHGCHQHTRRDLVAIADTNHRIGLMRIYHIFNAVRNDVAGRERVEHPVVPHRDTVVDGNRIELGCKATQLFDLRFHLLPDLVQMHMSGYKLGK